MYAPIAVPIRDVNAAIRGYGNASWHIEFTPIVLQCEVKDFVDAEGAQPKAVRDINASVGNRRHLQDKAKQVIPVSERSK